MGYHIIAGLPTMIICLVARVTGSLFPWPFTEPLITISTQLELITAPQYKYRSALTTFLSGFSQGVSTILVAGLRVPTARDAISIGG